MSLNAGKFRLLLLFSISFSLIIFNMKNTDLNPLKREKINSSLYEDKKPVNLEHCMQKNWRPLNTTHPHAPIYSMEKEGKNLILPLSYNATFCKTSKENLRLIFVLSRTSSFKNRQTIRSTYAQFDSYNQSSILDNWTLFFIVGKPTNQKSYSRIENESRQFGDVIVANVIEDYYNATYKVLIGLKVASCFCPNAGYVIKADDDVYIRLRKLDQVIVTQQWLVDVGAVQDKYYVTRKILSENHKRFFTGAVCSHSFEVFRIGKHQISKKNYPDSIYPFFCYGPFYLFRMETVHELVIDCPNHCTGQDGKKYLENREKFCFHQVEDVFIGSCISFTQQSKTIRTPIEKKFGEYISFSKLKDVPPEKHIAVHVDQSPDRILQVHKFYQNSNLT
ncbi:beta-1,3-galactosyltransferase 5-like [Convolutriloba macropyga]|uniref:beta-1,3-galactosyltransferase 5-like n=1 Tax=Convolutriloba macropyga TaxID=536237 RepID=UPI003F521E28